jgi:YD repeat-containing protein
MVFIISAFMFETVLAKEHDGWKSFQTPIYSGSYNISHVINLPAGTNGMSPTISISYKSYIANSKFGLISAGWEIPLSHIQANANGSYSMSLNGVKHDLVSTGGHYHTNIESWLKIEKKSGAANEKGEYWTVIGSNGTEYRFGYDRDSENMLNSSDPATTPGVWRWSLDRIKDANGNSIYFSYIEDQGAVYPYRIEYNSDRQRTIEFVLEDRPDPYQDVVQGSEITVAKRLSRINISVSGRPVKSLKFGYSPITAETPVSLLTSITKLADDGTPLSPTTFTYKSYTDSSEQTWLLETISEDLGGRTTVVYAPSSIYPDNQLPATYWLVSSVTRDNGMHAGNPHRTTDTTNFSYAQGRYDSKFDEFRGFGQVTETRPDGGLVIHTFHQDDAKKGKEAQALITDAGGNPFAKTVNTWNATNAGGAYTVTVDRVDEYTYDGRVDNPKHMANEYEYNQYGNKTMEVHYGDIDQYGDELYTVREYTVNEELWIVDKLKHTYSAESTNGSHLRESWFYYDGHTGLNVPPSAGNLTKEEHFLNTGGNPVTTYEYDSFGNRASIMDPEKRVTTVTYDNLTHTFPVRVTNAKGQTTEQEFNLVSGQPTMVKDPNGYVTTYKYDIFNRLIKEIKPGDDEGNPTTEITYLLDGTAPEGVKVSKREQSGTAKTLDAWQFVDGFGRLIQTKTEYKNSTKLIASDVFYDTMGRDYKHSNPYLTDPVADYSLPLNSSASVTEYDTLGRPTKTTNPDSTFVTTMYDHWTTTTSDENVHVKQRVYDANKNLRQVVEKNHVGVSNGALTAIDDTYTTNYLYNPLGELLQTLDNYGNSATYVYDTLGRKITASDPDHGRKDYAYDRAGNLIAQTDARSVTTKYSYDPLNRTLQVTYPHDKGIQYTYDRETIGTLAQVVDAVGTTSWKYDNRLRQVREDRTMDAMNWTTQWGYDALDRVVSQTYPDGNTVSFTYGTMGKLSSIPSILSSIDYNEKGQETLRSYANGLTTSFEYNPNNLRLKSIVTPAIQNFSYAYDNVANVQTIVNASVGTETFGYDDLNRLVTAGGTGSNAYQNTYAYNAIGNMLTETDTKGGTTSVAQYTYGLGGAGPHAVTGKSDAKPIIGLFSPNGGKAYSTKQQITLNNIALGSPTDYIASENADFSGAVWLPYSTAPTFTLSSGFVKKTVYFKVRKGSIETAVVSGEVSYLLDSTGTGIPDIYNTDMDGDGIPDAWEIAHGVPSGQAGSKAPSGLTYLQAYQYGTNPNKVDTDGDGWSDYDEIFVNHTNPNSVGFDNVHDGVSENYSLQSGRFNEGNGSRASSSFTMTDTLGKAIEVNSLLDTDGDGIPDIFDTDADGDGIPDAWEVANGINMTVPGHASIQLPDGLTVRQAYEYGVNPAKTDANGNGWSDYQEIFEYHTDPNQAGIHNVHDGVSQNYSLGNGNFNSGGGSRNEINATLTDVIGGPQSQWQNTANVIVAPATVDFGTVTGGTRTAHLTVTNSGSSTLSLGGITLGGATPLEFSLTNDNCSNSAIGPAGTCSFDALFSPAFGGAKGAILTIATDDAANPNLSVNLSGIAAATISELTPPAGSVAIKGNVALTNAQNITLALSASDPSGVGQVCISNANLCSDWQKYASEKPWLLPSGDGAFTVYVWFRDNAGNSTNAPVTATITVDTVPPLVNLSVAGGTYNSSQTVALTASKPSTIYFTTGGTNPTLQSAVYTTPLYIAGDTALKYFAVDAAGNIGAIQTAVYSIDSVAPVGTVTINNGALVTNTSTVTLKLNATDAGGLAGMSFSNDGVNWTVSESFGFSKSWTLPTGDGLKTVYVRYQDKAGNWSIPCSASITLRTHNLLTVHLDGTGSGSVHGTSTLQQNFACDQTSCSQGYAIGDMVSLFATPSSNALFAGWSGSCTGINPNCSVNLSADADATATFNVLPPLRIWGTVPNYFNTFIEAFAAMTDGSAVTLQSRAVTLTGGFSLNRPVTLTLKGGFDGAFDTHSDRTVIQGEMVIKKGLLRVEKIVVR